MTPGAVAAQASRRRVLVCALFAGVCVFSALSGCDPRQAMFFLQPFEPKIPPKCASLKGKRVVILTSSAGGLRTDYLNIDREIAKKLAEILRTNIKKIDVVDPAQVVAWVEGKPTWTDPAEAARAFDADVVIFLELREFQIQDPSSPGLFGGRSNIGVQVVELAHPKDDRGKPMNDQPKESKIIYDNDCTSAYPVAGHLPIEASLNSAVFKNKFLDIVVKEVSWGFVEHSPGDDIESSRFSQ